MNCRLIRIVSCLAGLSVLVGCQVHPSILYRDAVVYYQDGKLTESIATLQEAHEVRPGDANTCYLLGRCYLDLANEQAEAGRDSAAQRFADKALFYLNSAINAAPGHAPALRAKVAVMRLRGDQAAANETARWIGETLSVSVDTLVAKSQAYAAGGDLDEAMLACKQALALDPDNPKAHEWYGKFLLRVGKQDEGIEHLQRAYQIKPTLGLLQLLVDLDAVPSRKAQGVPSRSE